MVRRYKNWKLKDFKNYYKENYSGKSRSEVFGKDGGFYMTIRNKGFLEDVFPSTKWRWGGFSLKDFQDYYKKNCSGKSKSEILKEDYGFYQVVWRRNLLNSVFPKSKIRGSYKNWESENLQEYYKKNYPDKSRSEVFKEDSAFYNAVQRRNLLNSVFPKKKGHTGGGSKGKFSNFSFRDFKEYYEENYKGKSRFKVYEKDNKFYHALYKRGLLDKVLPKDKRGKEIRSYKNWKLKDFKDYYQKNCQGMTRSEISKKDNSFYSAFHNRGLLNKFFPWKKRRSWINFSLKDFKNYYKENYNGLTRFEIQKKDPSFYQIVCKKGLLDKVFPRKRSGRKSKFSNFSLKDFKNYYKENYKGLIKYEVRKKDQSFYRIIIKKNFQDKVFPEKRSGQPKSKFTNFSLEDFKNYYKENYSGKSRSEIAKKDTSFYQTLSNRGLLDEIVPRKTKDWRDFSLKDLKEYYYNNFEGIEEKVKEYLAFYSTVRKKGLIDKVFSKK